MKFGLGVRARTTGILTESVAAAVDAGFDHLWVYDSGRCVEAMVSLSYAALTSRLVVGTAVTNTQTREPAVLANALATLANLTGGRLICGIGLGDSAVKFLGRPAVRIVEFEERLKVIRALLHGESVTYNGADYRLPEPPARPPLLLVSVEGPKTCEIAARLGDGAILSLGASPAILELLVAQLREAASAAGRDVDHLYICAWLQAAMAGTRSAALEALRPQAGRTLLSAIKHAPRSALGRVIPTLDETALARIADLERRQSSEYELARELSDLVGETALAEFTVVGTASDCRAKVESLLAVRHVCELAFNVYGGSPRRSIPEFVSEVISPLRASMQAAATRSLGGTTT